jgi:CRISPR-associated protein Cas2
MTIAVTRDLPGRFRGLLASCMCEIAPGVYTAPRMTAGVRERLWAVLEEWWMAYPDGSILLTWPDSTRPGGQNLRTLGLPRQDLHDHWGVFLARRDFRKGRGPADPAGEDPAGDDPPTKPDEASGRAPPASDPDGRES